MLSQLRMPDDQPFLIGLTNRWQCREVGVGFHTFQCLSLYVERTRLGPWVGLQYISNHKTRVVDLISPLMLLAGEGTMEVPASGRRVLSPVDGWVTDTYFVQNTYHDVCSSGESSVPGRI